MSTIFFLGDNFARQPRDFMGLPARLASFHRDVPWPVLDLTVKGGIKDTYRQVGLIPQAPTPSGHAVLVVGARDCKGGGPPPSAFAAHVACVLSAMEGRVQGVLVIMAPACPHEETRNRMRGYGKGSRRWLGKARDHVHEMVLDVEHGLDLVVREADLVVPAGGWVDQLTLNLKGLTAVTEQLDAAVAGLGAATM